MGNEIILLALFGMGLIGGVIASTILPLLFFSMAVFMASCWGIGVYFIEKKINKQADAISNMETTIKAQQETISYLYTQRRYKK